MKVLALVLISAFAISCYGNYFNSEVLQRRKIVEEKCKIPIDLAIILDSSRTISKADWKNVKGFAKALVDSLDDVSKDGSHVAVMRFSQEAKVDLNFQAFKSDKMNAKGVKDVIDNLKHMKSSTFLDKALELANEEIFTAKAGMREDEKIKKIIVLMTDGMQTIRLEPYTPLIEASEPLKDRNVHIYTLGVGPALSLQQLVDMASSPSNVYSVPGFDSLLGKVVDFRLETCDCYEPLDVGVILDVSSSLQHPDFVNAIASILELLKQLHVGPDESQSHFGLLTYSTKEKVLEHYEFFKDQTLAKITKSINAIDYYKVAGSDTRTSAALKKAGELFFKPGTIGNRKDIDDIAILLTDGRSNDGYNVNAPFIKDTRIIVVAIGDDIKNNMGDLKKLSRGDTENNLIQVGGAKLSQEEIDTIVRKSCKG